MSQEHVMHVHWWVKSSQVKSSGEFTGVCKLLFGSS